MGKRVGAMLVVIGLVILCLAGSLGATVYSYQNLGGLGAPVGFSANVNGINDAKQIVGAFTQYISPFLISRAFIWEPAKGATQLKSLGAGTNCEAFGVNRQGQIVGQAVNNGGYSHACLWSNPAQAPADLTSAGDSTWSCALAINDNGVMAGYYCDTYNKSITHAYKWTAPLQWTNLGTLGGTTSKANSINNAGQIVGIAQNGQGNARACLWNPGQAGQDLAPSLPANAQANNCFINNRGNVAGDAYPGPTAFYWNHQTMALSNIGPQLNQSWALGLSDDNQVVGSGFQSGFALVFWNPKEGTQDLNTLVVNLPAGVTVKSLNAISPKGNIVGRDSAGNFCMLTPIASQPGFTLLLLD
jgi:probable HAF family extracellular repeat protein